MKREELYAQALKAADNAWAPYSNFRVGAAVLLEDGTVVRGANQENASYPLSMCAERVAIDYAKTTYPQLAISAIAIASPSTDRAVTPCGACRQVMAEVVRRQNSDFEVIYGNRNQLQISSVDELLPMSFSL